MSEYTTPQLAELFQVQRQVINYHIRKGNLKATFKALYNDSAKFYVTHEEYLRFSDWFFSEKGKNSGVAYKKIPAIDEYDLEPKKYHCYVALKIQRDKAILEAKYLRKEKYNNIALDFNLNLKTIQQIIIRHRETDFVKKLIIQYENNPPAIEEFKKPKKIRKIPNIDEYEENSEMYLDTVSVKIERDKEILQLKYLNNYSIKDIAKKFEMTFNNVYKIVMKNKETKFVKELEQMRDVFK